MNIRAMNLGQKPGKITSRDNAHWYTRDGEPMHTVIGKTTKQERSTTLADAKKLGLFPSVTTILKILNKPQLVEWMAKQVVLAVTTTPRLENEELDDYINRVLLVERVQDEEAMAASRLGTEIHKAMESLFKGEQISEDLRPWVEPAFNALKEQGFDDVITETVVVDSLGFAGTVDWIGQKKQSIMLVDFKSTKKVPKKTYLDHRLQLCAYAHALQEDISGKDIIISSTANLYISTTNQGEFQLHKNPPWNFDWQFGFEPLFTHWCWSNDYTP